MERALVPYTHPSGETVLLTIDAYRRRMAGRLAYSKSVPGVLLDLAGSPFDTTGLRALVRQVELERLEAALERTMLAAHYSSTVDEFERLWDKAKRQRAWLEILRSKPEPAMLQ
ncbi:MAG: hypothetical protein VYA51_12850 [Planctomycetota bacterium]|nr:hypothetical protein [Planctomycetota bacterium]